jgi:hypothetical protein
MMGRQSFYRFNLVLSSDFSVEAIRFCTPEFPEIG